MINISKALLISGLPPGSSGTGRFLEYFRGEFSDIFEFIHLGGPYDNEVRKKIRLIKNRQILIVHPQSIGFELFRTIVLKNTCFLYVMDNSFFCGASYNIIPRENKPCFRCLKSRIHEKKENCTNLWNFKDFSDVADKIRFFAQNKNQKKLLKKKFGKKTDIIVTGLNVSDISERLPRKLNQRQYDIIYHGSENFAKGYVFAKKLDEQLGGDKIYFPASGETWETGLKEKIINSKIVLNPSLWSSPVEGALLKSIKYNGCVSVANILSSFINEIPDDICLKLNPRSVTDSCKKLNDLLKNKERRQVLRLKSKSWLDQYVNSVNQNLKTTIRSQFKKVETRKIDSIYSGKINEQEIFFKSNVITENLSNIGNYSVYGLSVRTKYLIKQKKIYPKYIIDKNTSLHGKKFFKIQIISPHSKKVSESENIIIISNHKRLIYRDLTSKFHNVKLYHL